MSFNLQGGNAVANDYDYQSGSGMDSFMSRSIDEISWQTNLATTYNSLGSLPIGTMPTTSTATNYDSTQITGSQSGSSSLGGSAGGSALGTGGGATAGIQIQSGENNISVNDGTNDRAIMGYNQYTNTWGFFATPPGTDISNAHTPQQLAMSSDFSQVLIAISGSYTFPVLTGTTPTEYSQSATIPHGLSFAPAFLAYVLIENTAYINFPVTGYYQQVTAGYTLEDVGNVSYSYNAAADSTNLYLNRVVFGAATWTAVPSTINYYVFQQSASVALPAPNVTAVTKTFP